MKSMAIKLEAKLNHLRELSKSKGLDAEAFESGFEKGYINGSNDMLDKCVHVLKKYGSKSGEHFHELLGDLERMRKSV